MASPGPQPPCSPCGTPGWLPRAGLPLPTPRVSSARRVLDQAPGRLSVHSQSWRQPAPLWRPVLRNASSASSEGHRSVSGSSHARGLANAVLLPRFRGGCPTYQPTEWSTWLFSADQVTQPAASSLGVLSAQVTSALVFSSVEWENWSSPHLKGL